MSMPIMGITTGNEAAYPTSAITITNPDVGVSDAVTADEKQEIERLRSQSDMYQKYAPLWNFFLSAYEGGVDFAIGTNVFRHPREHLDDFQERSKRLYYHNYCYPLVDFFTTFIFTETIQRDGGANSAFYNDFVKNVNRRGDDITQFMMHVCDDMQIFGLTYVMVDAPKKDPNKSAVTQAQQSELGIQPYWVSVRPTEILDWVVDSFDNFLYLKRVQFITTVDASMNKTQIERYFEWTPENIKISDIDISNPDKPALVSGSETVENEMKTVPFVPVRYKRSKKDKFMGLSFLNDLAFINREVMNITSLLQEFLYRQCFNILAMEESDTVPEIHVNQGEVGTANMLRYPEGTKEPKYITPPSQPAEFLQSERAANIISMYKIAAQDTQNDLFNGAKASGFSKAQSFATTVPKIATRAESLESAEVKLMRLTLQYVNKKWDGTIKYKDHYQITNLTDAINQLSMLFKDLQINSKTFAEMQMKRMIDEFDGKLTPEQRKMVYNEIEAIDWPEWFDVMKLSFLGRAATAPAASATLDEPDAKAIAEAVALKGVGTPVKGKDTATAASTPQRGQSGTTEVSKEAKGGAKK